MTTPPDQPDPSTVGPGPRVTVVVPTHDRARLLPRALAGLLAQTVGDLEVVVVDDGSTDDTAAVLAAVTDPRVRTLRQANAGAAAARNAGAAVARGALLTFLDSDDEVDPQWLASLVGAGTGEEVVCCGYTAVEGERRVVTLPGPLRPAYGDRRGLFTKAGVYLLPTALFHEIGGFDPDLRSGQHSELALRLVRRTPAVVVREVARPLVVVHVHGGARIRSSAQARMLGPARVVEQHPWIRHRDPQMWADYHGVAGVAAASLGELPRARRHFRAAVAVRPTQPRHALRLLATFLPVGLRRRWGRDVGGLGGSG